MRLIRPLLVAASLLAVHGARERAAQPASPIPGDAADVVIRVSTGGGFVAPQSQLGRVPEFTLYGDGTIIVPGAVPQISPGPAIRPLLRRHLREPEVQALLRLAVRAGLLARHPIDYGDLGSIGISDAPSTTVRLHAAGRHVRARGVCARRRRRTRAAGAGGGTPRARPLRRCAADPPGRRALRAARTRGLPHAGERRWSARERPRDPLAARWRSGEGRPGPAGGHWLPLPRPARQRGADAARAAPHGTTTGRGGSGARGARPAYALIARALLPDERSCASQLRRVEESRCLTTCVRVTLVHDLR